jgi:hypothetical protein
MRTSAKNATLILLFACPLAGCGSYWSSTFLRRKYLGEAQTLATTADLRLVTSTVPGDFSTHGWINPRQIICAEPSPDVAKAVSAALQMSASADVAIQTANGPAEKGSGAGALSSARAESLAQLTQRLATIQLLRDGLYRACEAYANGAISDTTYAVLLSRYDKAMITMLLGELAAGNFGQSPVVVGGTATGSAEAAKGSADAQEKLQKLNDEVAADQKAYDDAKTASDAAPDDADKKTTLDAADAALKKAQDDQRAASLEALKAVSAFASSEVSAGITQAAAAITHTADSSAKDVLLTMQRKYIENINFDPMIVACISALDRSPADDRHDTVLAQKCRDNLDWVLGVQSKLLENVAGPEAEIGKSDRYFSKAIDRITKAKEQLQQLEPTPPATPK